MDKNIANLLMNDHIYSYRLLIRHAVYDLVIGSIDPECGIANEDHCACEDCFGYGLVDQLAHVYILYYMISNSQIGRYSYNLNIFSKYVRRALLKQLAPPQIIM